MPAVHTGTWSTRARNGRLAYAHVEITYEGWRMARAWPAHRPWGHGVQVRQLAIENVYLGIGKRVLRRSISLLCGKTNRLHALIFATQRIGVAVLPYGEWGY